MKISSIRIENWKSLSDTDHLALGDVNVFVGRNNTGKSAILRAVRLLQYGHTVEGSDIRLGETQALISIGVASGTLGADVSRHYRRALAFGEDQSLEITIEIGRAQ